MEADKIPGRNPLEAEVDQAPATVNEWADLLMKLIHLRVEPPKESHDISVVPVVSSKVNGPAKTFTVYPSVDVRLGVDALVTGVSYNPPKLPIKVGDEWKHEMDVLFPHGRLSLTVDVFLDGPIGVQEVTKRDTA